MTAFAWYLNKYYPKSKDDPIFREIVEGKTPIDKFHVPHSKNCPALWSDLYGEDFNCTCGLTALASSHLLEFALLRAKWHAALLLSTAQAILRALLSLNQRTWFEVRDDIEFERHKYRSLRKVLYWPPSIDQVTQPLPQDLIRRIQGEQVSFPEKQTQASDIEQVKA